MQVKALSIKNPVSYLVAAGVKDVENRTWPTTYRGRLYIHSSGAKDFFFFSERCARDLANFDRIADLPDDHWSSIAMERFFNWQAARYGLPNFDDRDANLAASKARGLQLLARSIIGAVDLVDIVQDSTSEWALPGQYHWILKNAELFDKPIGGVEGRLKIFQVDI